MNADAKDLLQKILIQEPNQRISLVEMLKHPFFTKYFPNAVNELTKPNHNDIPPYVVSKDTPQSVLKKKERKIIKRYRGNSPHPVSKLHLEKLKHTNNDTTALNGNNGMNINTVVTNTNMVCNSNDAILTAEKEILIVEKEQIQKKYDDLLLSYSNIQSIHNESLKTIDSANDTIRKLQKDKEALLRDIDEKDCILEELKHSLDDERNNTSCSSSINSNNVLPRTKSFKKTNSGVIITNSNSCSTGNNDKQQQVVLELEETLKEKDNEIAELKRKIKQLGGNVNDDDDIVDEVSEKERVQKEIFVQKEKYETIIKELKKTQAQCEMEREKEKKRLVGLIKKYEKMLDIQSTETKRLKEKKKELETTLTKLRLSNMDNSK
jgi:serine/threonine protein kinase